MIHERWVGSRFTQSHLVGKNYILALTPLCQLDDYERHEYQSQVERRFSKRRRRAFSGSSALDADDIVDEKKRRREEEEESSVEVVL